MRLIRKIHHFSREYINDLDDIVKSDRSKFFPTIELYNGFNNAIVLDFDGVITKKSFEKLYLLCCERSKHIIVCSGNPTVNDDYFIKRGLPLPKKIHACKGKIKKMICLIELLRKYDNLFYIDNEIEYLEFAWIFGIKTFQFKNNKIVYFTRKTQ